MSIAMSKYHRFGPDKENNEKFILLVGSYSLVEPNKRTMGVGRGSSAKTSVGMERMDSQAYMVMS